MIITLRALGVGIMIIGFFFLKGPSFINRYITFWKQKNKLRLAAVLAITIGTVSLIAAPSCRLPLFMKFFGVLSIMKGVLLLTLKERHIMNYIDWWLAKPLTVLQNYLGILALVFGIALIYAA